MKLLNATVVLRNTYTRMATPKAYSLFFITSTKGFESVFTREPY